MLAVELAGVSRTVRVTGSCDFMMVMVLRSTSMPWQRTLPQSWSGLMMRSETVPLRFEPSAAVAVMPTSIISG